jgi:uncharacterized protein (DUF2062 family)
MSTRPLMAELPRGRTPPRLTAVLHQIRTEGGTPGRQACAVGLGLYIGATPFLGFHLALSILLGRLFGLNRLLVYAAANISNPFIAPVLYATEIQVGAWLRTGAIYSPSTVERIRLGGLALDVLIGSVVIGLALGIAGLAITYAVARARDRSAAAARLVDAAAARFLPFGFGAWEFARNKIRHDPMYLGVLRDGVLPARGRLLDLGCGHGLMLALLAAARVQFRAGDWPADWPAPPLDLALHGIELRPKAARRAREALGADAVIEERDLTAGGVPPCDAILIFDVLHLLPADAQERLLDAAAGALAPGGVLVLREADAAGGWRFHMVRFGNRLVGFVHGKGRRRFHFRTADEWRRLLEMRGLVVDEAQTPNRTPFANVTFYAKQS